MSAPERPQAGHHVRRRRRRPAGAAGIPDRRRRRRPPMQLGAPTAAGFAIPNTHVRNLVAALAGILLGFIVTEVTGMADSGPPHRPSRTSRTACGSPCSASSSRSCSSAGSTSRRAAAKACCSRQARRPMGRGARLRRRLPANVIFDVLADQAFESGSSGGFYVAAHPRLGDLRRRYGRRHGRARPLTQKLVNGALGGLAGGAAGGARVRVHRRNVSSTFVARLFGLVFIAAGIGLAIGLVETLRRQAWFQIVGGGMAGKEFVLYEGETARGQRAQVRHHADQGPGRRAFHFTISPETAAAVR